MADQLIYNTLDRKKEPFKPLVPGEVKLYLCGPTVYDLLHIGNFRGAIFFNLVWNWFEKQGFDVKFIYNYTDVDDKIINKAKEEGISSTEVSERFIEEFEKDFSRLGLRPHTRNPRVTEFIPQIVEFIQDLVKKESAYVVDGEVFYSIDHFEHYGKLSGKNLEELEAGQRVDVDPRKKNPFDFVLWKPSKEGEPAWGSPWGKGRPGWHIECSAMIQSLLGETIDIHGGGVDLIFPHHENEIAQGEGRTGKPYCQHWIHNEFINLKGEKMSKSLGNVITGRAFMDKYHPEILKYLYLSVHYRSILNINEERVHGVISALDRVYNALANADRIKNFPTEGGKPNKKFVENLKQLDSKIEKALRDDFNTGEAMGYLFEGIRAFNALNLLKKAKDPNSRPTAEAFREWIDKYGQMMALFQEGPIEFLKTLDDVLLKEKDLSREEIDKLVAERKSAREQKDFAKSDEIRERLTEMGINVQDGSEERPWEVIKT